MVNTGSHGTNTPFEKELWTMYSSHSVQICCKQWAKGLCVGSYWPLYGVNVPVPSQAVCSNDRAVGWGLRLRFGQVESGLVWTSRRLSCHISSRQGVEFGSENHNELGEKRQHNIKHFWLTSLLCTIHGSSSLVLSSFPPAWDWYEKVLTYSGIEEGC